MRILVEGNSVNEKQYTCSICKCIFAYTKEDEVFDKVTSKQQMDGYDVEYYHIICPYCNKTIKLVRPYYRRKS